MKIKNLFKSELRSIYGVNKDAKFWKLGRKLLEKLKFEDYIVGDFGYYDSNLDSEVKKEINIKKMIDTKLGFEIDKEKSDWGSCNFKEKSGKIHLEGELILNFNKVRVIADADIKTFKGTGYLEFIKEVEIGSED